MGKVIIEIFTKFKTELLSLAIFLSPFILISRKVELRGMLLLLLFVSVYLLLFALTCKIKYRKTLYYIQPFLAVNITSSIVFMDVIMLFRESIETYTYSYAWLLTAILLTVQAIRDKKINWFNALYILLSVGLTAHFLFSPV